LCKSCRTSFMFYCMFYFICDCFLRRACLHATPGRASASGGTGKLTILCKLYAAATVKQYQRDFLPPGGRGNGTDARILHHNGTELRSGKEHTIFAENNCRHSKYGGRQRCAQTSSRMTQFLQSCCILSRGSPLAVRAS